MMTIRILPPKHSAMGAMRPRWLVAVACVLASAGVAAYDVERAGLNFAHELAECSAYYALIAEEPGIDAATRANRRATGVSLAMVAGDIASENFVNTRIDRATAYMQRDMKNSWRNISVIKDKYGPSCQNIVADREARRKYWLDKGN